MPLTTVVFDMDGLMVDTEPLSRRAWEQVITPFGAVLTDAVYGRMIGHHTAEAAQILLHRQIFLYRLKNWWGRKRPFSTKSWRKVYRSCPA